MNSPYKGKNQNEWLAVTKHLITKHPLSTKEIKEVVLESWKEIFRSTIGKKNYRIGKDIFPKPQIMGFFLHEIIALEFERRYPKEWRKEKLAKDKDLIYIRDDKFSIEIKTSSNPKSIFGNRSYAQESSKDKKSKSGYYLAINFEKCTVENIKPKILKARFGWLDHEDWMGQKAATGQQSRLSSQVENLKLIDL
ncbi:MAG: restriction endonuclease [Dehalococcoidia bacterium]|nr:restriction endonuclease [Dehalococcoidia bacterium]